MAKKGLARGLYALVCSVCKSQNYITTKNKLNTQNKLLLKKFCKRCRKVTDHKESSKFK